MRRAEVEFSSVAVLRPCLRAIDLWSVCVTIPAMADRDNFDYASLVNYVERDFEYVGC